MQCLTRKINLSKPISSELSYDFIADGSSLKKIQVKGGASRTENGGYKVCLYKGNNKKTKYLLQEVDVFALYIEPLDRWYIIPFNCIDTAYFLVSSKWDDYIDAWYKI
jgi:hypothetical protein